MRVTIASGTQSTLRTVLGALLALVSVTGCAARGNESPEPRPGTALISKVREMLVEPSILTWGEQELTARCMAKQGFTYEVKPASAGVPDAALPSLGGFGTPLTLEQASGGYPATHSRRPAPTRSEPGRAVGYDGALDVENARQVQIRIGGLTVGASTRGCAAAARRQLYGSVRNYLMVEYAAQGIRQFGGAALENAQVQLAVAKYEACMRSAGYAAGNPGVARQLAERRFRRNGLDKTSPSEVRMAMSDARCQNRSDVYSLLDEAVADAASSWLRANESDLEKTFEIRSRAMNTALELRQSSSRR